MFKAGDKVVCKDVSGTPFRKGEEYIVYDFKVGDYENTQYVYFSLWGGGYLPYRFEKVEPKTYLERQEEWLKENNVEPGTKLRIVGKTKPDGWLNDWVSDMDIHIGEEFNFTDSNCIGICAFGWTYPFTSLEIVEQEKKMKTVYTYKARSAAERSAVLTYLLNVGFKWHNEEDWNADKIERVFPFNYHPSIEVNTDMNSIQGVGPSSHNSTLEEMFSLESKELFKPVEFDLEEYTAIIHKDFVEVGCQKFAHEEVIELGRKIREGVEVKLNEELSGYLTMNGLDVDGDLYPYSLVLDLIDKVKEIQNK